MAPAQLRVPASLISLVRSTSAEAQNGELDYTSKQVYCGAGKGGCDLAMKRG